MVKFTVNCINGHGVSLKWELKIKGAEVGNLLLTATILFSGNMYKRISDFPQHFNL